MIKEVAFLKLIMKNFIQKSVLSKICSDNISISKKNVLRGLRFQKINLKENLSLYKRINFRCSGRLKKIKNFGGYSKFVFDDF